MYFCELLFLLWSPSESALSFLVEKSDSMAGITDGPHGPRLDSDQWLRVAESHSSLPFAQTSR